MNMDYPIPTEELHIFSYGDLLSLYTFYLEPYLGPQALFIDKEKALMGEVYKVLEDNDYPGFTNLSDIVKGIFIPSDVLNSFFNLFYRTIDNLTASMEYYLKGKILIELEIKGGYTLLAKTMTPICLHHRALS